MTRTDADVGAHIATMIADLPDGYDTAERRTSIAVSCALGHTALNHTNRALYGILLTWWQGSVSAGRDPAATVALHLDFYGPGWVRDAAVLAPLCDQIARIIGSVDLHDDQVCASRWKAAAAALRRCVQASPAALDAPTGEPAGAEAA